jgi:hypothetical protein
MFNALISLIEALIVLKNESELMIDDIDGGGDIYERIREISSEKNAIISGRMIKINGNEFKKKYWEYKSYELLKMV